MFFLNLSDIVELFSSKFMFDKSLFFESLLFKKTGLSKIILTSAGKIFFLKVVSAVKSKTILFTPELKPYLISFISVENNSLLLKKNKRVIIMNLRTINLDYYLIILYIVLFF